MGDGRHDHAVVVGASMAGLLVARELADRFASVTVLERDALTDGADTRRGVPQGRHVHVLLAAGERILAERFPGLPDALRAHDAQLIDLGAGVLWAQGGYLTRSAQPQPAFMMSRPLLEWVVRDHLRACANVEIRGGQAVRALLARGGRVTGVLVTGAEPSTIAGDLIVDCSGRSSPAPRWLEQLGFAAPPVSHVVVDVGYASCVVARDAGDLTGSWAASMSTPPGTRLGVLAPIERGRWMCSLVGFHGDHPPGDARGFLAFARSLPSPEIATILERAGPGAPIVTHRFPSSRRRHFEKLRHHPIGFVVAGDALCSFNPTYGQGMTVAALQSRALATALDRHDPASPRLAATFYQHAATALRVPWQTAAGGDFQWPDTTGRRPRGVATTNRYVARVLRAAHHDPTVAWRFGQVQSLVQPPWALATPAMLWRVWRRGRRIALNG